ncbi:BMC domain protein [Novipirellula aureliae]|uniref:BMC domain protein n=1 Tax=Novipirellula aureliae TaxID=2527966 RepID=A0A5C6E720_9BACT|nr:BMC domain-containing protein [Novipirellula aureliae]TWU43266.1 BMC domain protein [Novipirellula aureliae]
MENGKAIGIVETSSIARGFMIADTVLKSANVKIIVNRTICPGKYMVLIGGNVDAVTSAIEAGVKAGAHTVVDHFVIPNVHPSVFPAISGVSQLPELKALGVIEAFSVASVIEAADAAVKATQVQLITIHLAMAIGGKGWVSLTGDVASVNEAVEVGGAVIERKGLLVDKVVISAPRPEIIQEFV